MKPLLFLIAATLLFAAVLVLPRLSAPAVERAAELAALIAAAGGELEWRSARLDIGLGLILDGVELGGPTCETLRLASHGLSLEGCSIAADELPLVAHLAQSTKLTNVSLDGVVGGPVGFFLDGSWRGCLRDGRLLLDGAGELSGGEQALTCGASWLVSEQRVIGRLATEASLAYLDVGSEPYLYAPAVEFTELRSLFGDYPFEGRGGLAVRGRPGEDRWRATAAALELRRPGAPGYYRLPSLSLTLDGSAWLLELGRQGYLAGDAAGLRRADLELELDVAAAARSLLPLGSSGAGRLGLSLEIAPGTPPAPVIEARDVELRLADGPGLALDGTLKARGGSLVGAGSLDLGGGDVEYEATADGLSLVGTDLDLRAALDGLARWRTELQEAFGSLYTELLAAHAPLTVAVETAAARWGGRSLGDLEGEVVCDGDGIRTVLTLHRADGSAELNWRTGATGRRISAAWRGLPVELFNAFGFDTPGLEPVAGVCRGGLELRWADSAVAALDLRLVVEDLTLSTLPPPLAALWRWCDTGAEPPDIADARLILDWNTALDDAGDIAITLTTPDLRVTLGAAASARWDGPLDLVGTVELTPELTARMLERGVLVFRTVSGWGAKPFRISGSWRDPQVRLDVAGSRRLAAAEPPPGLD